MQHDEIETANSVVLPFLGDVAHFVRNQAADGVEVFAQRFIVEGNAERFGHPLDGRVAGNTVSMVCQSENIAFVASDIELILDFSDDLFQHVFDGDEPRHTPEFVDHDGKVLPVSAKVSQQVVQAFGLGHEHGGP